MKGFFFYSRQDTPGKMSLSGRNFSPRIDLPSKLEKTATIRRSAIRETCVSRHHEGPIKGPLIRLEHQGTLVSRGLRGPFNAAPIMSKMVSLLAPNETKFGL